MMEHYIGNVIYPSVRPFFKGHQSCPIITKSKEMTKCKIVSLSGHIKIWFWIKVMNVLESHMSARETNKLKP